MEEDFLFKCDICAESFDAEPDAMVSLDNALYLTNQDQVVLDWEGSNTINNSDIPETFQTEQILIPKEFSNNAYCICGKCRKNYL